MLRPIEIQNPQNIFKSPFDHRTPPRTLPLSYHLRIKSPLSLSLLLHFHFSLSLTFFCNSLFQVCIYVKIISETSPFLLLLLRRLCDFNAHSIFIEIQYLYFIRRPRSSRSSPSPNHVVLVVTVTER
ncbi:hypothetical protein K2173_010038 [Erythroxylum novogranatense]|uniref:Uncharacterized protein n=1 Tax=Erythroxylum novogranatense TaxID=1862640 RepID=A0AAV8TSW3_9ROSI|nr:hypothetical protein K2173_010038 [Erythroxylum novogranatense]